MPAPPIANRRGRAVLFKPTNADRKLVSILSSLGVPQDDICKQVINKALQTPKHIDRKTLAKHFKEELATGTASANIKIATRLFERAMGNGPQSVTALIFWLKCRAGWKESQMVQVSGKLESAGPPPKNVDWLGFPTEPEKKDDKDSGEPEPQAA